MLSALTKIKPVRELIVVAFFPVNWVNLNGTLSGNLHKKEMCANYVTLQGPPFCMRIRSESLDKPGILVLCPI